MFVLSVFIISAGKPGVDLCMCYSSEYTTCFCEFGTLLLKSNFQKLIKVQILHTKLYIEI